MIIRNVSNTVFRKIKKAVRQNSFDICLSDDIIRDHFYNIYRIDDLNAAYENIKFPDIVIEQTMKDLNTKDDYEAIDQLYEDLACWLTYYNPPSYYVDINIALDCDLIPFYYKGEFYLALDGCGMDLSPKLDAYQYLTSGTFPSDTKFFSQLDYFRDIVGRKIFNKIMKRIGSSYYGVYLKIDGNFRLRYTKQGWKLINRSK